MKKEDKLDSFIAREKFSAASWQERGLIPSDLKTINQMSITINEIAINVRTVYQEGKPKRSIKKLLEKNIEEIINEGVFDTEETEFLIDLIYDLASIINIQLSEGPDEEINSAEKIEYARQKCDYCGVYLTTLILSKTEEINYVAWDIVKCNNCAGLNLISLNPYTKKFIGQGYEFVKQLNKKKYDKEAAIKILNEMKKVGQ